MKTAEVEMLAAAGILLALVVLVPKVAKAGAQAASNVDGAATAAVLSIPGMSVFQDAAGDFDPVQAGQEAAQSTLQWFSSLGNVVSGSLTSGAQAAGWQVTPADVSNAGLYPSTFGNYVSM